MPRFGSCVKRTRTGSRRRSTTRGHSGSPCRGSFSRPLHRSSWFDPGTRAASYFGSCVHFAQAASETAQKDGPHPDPVVKCGPTYDRAAPLRPLDELTIFTAQYVRVSEQTRMPFDSESRSCREEEPVSPQPTASSDA